MAEMSKTHDEIKKGLECCSNVNFVCNEECPYYKSLSEGEDCCLKKNADALAYIQQLEYANAEMLTRCKRLERERDALLTDISSVQGCICIICKKYINPNPGTGTAECKMLGRFADHDFDGALTCGQFEWRGAKEG